MTRSQFAIVMLATFVIDRVLYVAFAAQELGHTWLSVGLRAAAFAIIYVVVAPALNDRT